MAMQPMNGTKAQVLFALAFVALSGFPSLLRAQNPETVKPEAAAQQQPIATSPVIRTESRVVLVDAVVTDKKGNYVHNLTQKDFKVFEDNKEQAVASFSFGADAAIQAQGQKKYLILFFDNSTMAMPDQIQARDAAKKFIDANAGPDRLMAVVEFGGICLYSPQRINERYPTHICRGR